MTSADRWKEISALFNGALGQPADERAAYLERECPDEDIRQQVETLLACETPAEQFLGASAAQLAAIAEADGGALVGRQLGSYRIDSVLGAGGMGQVYKATDTRLDRTVAVKVLPLAFRDNFTFQQRFEREARAIAGLRHPHICVLHDVGREGDTPFLVMEYLEGETLAARLAKGPLPFDEVIRCANEIASALVEMHAHGVIHRDLKPANIMLTKAGAQLLDFGLARLEPPFADVPAAAGTPVPRSADDVETFGLTSRAGTLSYMAPEQVRGEAIDHRADIFAFGAILYEMATGSKAFTGDDAAAVANAVLHHDPPPVPAATGTPAGLGAVLRRCLQKDPAERWPDAVTMSDALKEVATPSRRPDWLSRNRRRAAALSVVTGIVAVVAIWGWSSGAGVESNGSQLVVGRQQQLTAADESELDPSFSPDGSLIAYTVGQGARFRTAVRAIATNREIAVPTDPGGLQLQPRWSPDGKELLHISREGVFVWPLTGGPPRRVATPSDDRGRYSQFVPSSMITSAAWAPHGREIAVAYGGVLVSIDMRTGARRRLVTRPEELHWCDWSPTGTWIACTAGNLHLPFFQHYFGNAAPSAIVVVPAAGGASVEIAPNTSMNQSPVWSADGRRLYFVSNRSGTSDVYAVDIGDGGAPVGNARRLTTGLGAFSIAMTADGRRLGYTQLAASGNVWSLPIPSPDVPVGIGGARQLTSGNQVVEAMHVTADRKWLVYDSDLHGQSDIFRMALGGGQPTRLTADLADDFAPSVSSDSRWLAFHSFRTKSRDVFVQPFEGGPAQQVTATPGQESYPFWFPDGSLAFVDQAVDAAGQFRGTFRTRPTPGAGWQEPTLFLPRGGGVTLIGDGRIIYFLDSIPHIKGRDDDPRVLYRPSPPALPSPEQFRVGDDGRTVYFKAHDPDGRASFWVLPLTGAPPRMLVRFDDLARPSRRWDFAVGDGRFFFTIDERRSNIWLADVREQ